MSISYTPEEITEILNDYFSGITHKQYIGARYVPIFGRKDEDSIIWDNTGTYEPLTIVLYQGNSYTSRQYVPIGVEITDEAYWALTGNYNAQVEMYRQEVARLADSLPSDNFDSTNTVKKYIDDSVSGFQSQVDAMSYDGIEYSNGIEEHYVWNTIRFSKEKFIANFALSDDGETACPLVDYVRRKKPFFCTNVTNSSSFVFAGTVYGELYAAPSRAAFYAKRNLNEEDFTVIKCDGETTQADILNLGFNYVGGGWQALVMNNQPWVIDDYETFHVYMPYQLFAWDDDYYYITQIFGRLSGKRGMLMLEAQNFAIANGWPNCVAFDSGDSMREYFGEEAPICISHRFNPNNYDRDAYYNLTIYRKNS